MAEPSHLEIARKFMGTQEIAGSKHNPIILKWFEQSGNGWIKDDETAWCAAFVNGVLADAGIKGTGSVAARSFQQWGIPVTAPKPGDIAVFWRGSKQGWQGHVGFYVGTTGGGMIRVLGGNQDNGVVSIASYPQGRLLGYRRQATMGNSNAVKGIVPTAVGGVAVLVPQVQETVQVIEGQKEALSGESMVMLAIGAIIILGALVALYAKWDDAGKPTPWKRKQAADREVPVEGWT